MSYLVQKGKKREEGFTLIELIIVIAIIGILMAIAIPNYMTARQAAAAGATKANLRNLATAAELCMAEKGEYPADEGELETYFAGGLPKTPKGKDYEHDLEDDDFLIYDPDPYPLGENGDDVWYAVGPGGMIQEGTVATGGGFTPNT